MNSDREDPNPTAPANGPGLSTDQLKAKLSRYVGALPSTVIEDLFQTLKPMALPESKVDEIIDRTIKSYTGQESNSRIDEIVEKMNSLEDTLIRALKSMENRQERANIEPEPMPEARPAPVTQSTFVPEPRVAKELEPDVEEDSPAQPLRSSTGSGREQRILLPDVPEDAISNAVLLKWVEFLLETVGHQNLPEILDYYVDIGWISEKVTMKLLAYASGMVAPRGRAKERLSTKDHLRSLLFIEKLRGRDFDQGNFFIKPNLG